MMKKVMLLSTIAVLCAAVSVQAEVLYLDTFEGDGLAANTGTGGGMINRTILDGVWSDDSDVDDVGAIYTSNHTAYQRRAYMYSENAFQSNNGFRLTVYYTTSTINNSAGHSFAWGLVSDETDLSTYSSTVANSSNPIGHIETVYSLGVNLTVWNKYTQGLSFVDGTGEPIVLDESGTNQQFVANASTPVVIEFDGDGNWSYWINGVEEASGTHPGGFDMSKSYHVLVYGQDDNGDKSVQSIMLETLGPGLSAHTPTPASGDTILSNDVPATTSVSWLSPLVDSDGNAIPDSNIVSIDNYAVWWGIGEEPNIVTDTPTNQTAQMYTPTTPITYDTTYYWRVDTTITLDSNEITGNFTEVIDGSTWNFTTEPSYTPVAIASFDNAITTDDIGTAPLAVELTGNSEPIIFVSFEILTDDIGYPGGSDAIVTNTTIDNQYPTATLTTSVTGTYKVKVTVTDDNDEGPDTTVEAIAEVAVYEDACQAKKDAPSVWAANYYDRDGDCIVNLGDYSVFAAEWLDDTSMQLQEEYTGVAAYVPQAVYDTRIEAEWYDPNDPNAFSGCIIQENEGASGGKNIGNNGQGSWVDYMIDVPPSAVGVPVDAYIGYGLISGTRTVSFGTEADPAAYGTAEALSTGDWYNFVGHYGGQVTFTASGSQEIRATCSSGGLNLDWFSFDW